jgi:hypothetical protein
MQAEVFKNPVLKGLTKNAIDTFREEYRDYKERVESPKYMCILDWFLFAVTIVCACFWLCIAVYILCRLMLNMKMLFIKWRKLRLTTNKDIYLIFRIAYGSSLDIVDDII